MRQWYFHCCTVRFRYYLRWRLGSGCCKCHILPTARFLNLRPAERRRLATVTYLSTPRLMITHGFDPFPLDESICASMPNRPQCKVTLASWMGPMMVFSHNTPYGSVVEFSRMAESSRHVVVIPTFAIRISGRGSKYCPTSTCFENPASRDLTQALEFQLSFFVVRGTDRFLDARSNKSGCFVPRKVRHQVLCNVEIFVWGNVVITTVCDCFQQRFRGNWVCGVKGRRSSTSLA